MALQNILSPELTLCHIAGGSKKRLIEKSAQLIASQVSQVSANQIYDAIVDNPVDLLFFLLVPENANIGHLESLRLLAEHFSNPEFCQKLRAANTAAELYSVAISSI